MLVFVVFGLFLILMTLYTYFYVSANTAALILIALIIYVPYFILKTVENVDFKSQIAELLAGKKIFRDFLRKSNFFGLMRTLYQSAPKLLKIGEDYEDTSFTIHKDDLTVRFYKNSNGDIKVSLRGNFSGIEVYEIFADELFWMPECRNITVLNMIVLTIKSIIGDELTAEIEKAKTRTYSMLYDKNLLNYGARAYLTEAIEDGFGSVILDHGYDLNKPLLYAVDLENRMVTLYQEKLDAMVAVLQFNDTRWQDLRERQIIAIKEPA